MTKIAELKSPESIDSLQKLLYQSERRFRKLFEAQEDRFKKLLTSEEVPENIGKILESVVTQEPTKTISRYIENKDGKLNIVKSLSTGEITNQYTRNVEDEIPSLMPKRINRNDKFHIKIKRKIN